MGSFFQSSPSPKLPYLLHGSESSVPTAPWTIGQAQAQHPRNELSPSSWLPSYSLSLVPPRHKCAEDRCLVNTTHLLTYVQFIRWFFCKLRIRYGTPGGVQWTEYWCLPKSTCWNPIYQCDSIRRPGHEKRALMIGIGDLIRKPRELVILFYHMRTQWEGAVPEPGNGPSPDANSAATLILNF